MCRSRPLSRVHSRAIGFMGQEAVRQVQSACRGGLQLIRHRCTRRDSRVSPVLATNELPHALQRGSGAVKGVIKHYHLINSVLRRVQQLQQCRRRHIDRGSRPGTQEQAGTRTCDIPYPLLFYSQLVSPLPGRPPPRGCHRLERPPGKTCMRPP